jgi:hypothetical protein
MAYLEADGTGEVSLELALNDEPGRWQIVATDVATGLRATAPLQVR